MYVLIANARQWVTFFMILLMTSTTGCTKSSNCDLVQSASAASENSPEHPSSVGDQKLTHSADYVLSASDFDAFFPGRPKDELLKDLEWKGNLEMAAEIGANSVCAISYGLFGGPFSSDPRAEVIWAIFIDDKFVKFVGLPDWSNFPIEVGDFSNLVQAVESDAVDIQALLDRKAPQAQGQQPSDLGLTAVWLLVGISVENARQRDINRNRQLRDQFNGMRLKLGMSPDEVEATIRAKPLESGVVNTGFYQIYGSLEVLRVMPYLHYSNILTLFTNDRLTGIYSGATIPGGEWGLRSLRELVEYRGGFRHSFSDLPALNE